MTRRESGVNLLAVGAWCIVGCVVLVALLVGCARSAADRDRSLRADSLSLLGQRTDSALARLVRSGWTLDKFTTHRQELRRNDDALMGLYSQSGHVCYLHLVSSHTVGYDPERPDSMLVYMPGDDVKTAYARWLGHLIGPHGLPVASTSDSASWRTVRITHGTEFLHGFVGNAAGCLEASDPKQDIRDK